MKKNTGNQEPKNHIQAFAVKINKKKIIVNNRAVIYNRCSTEKQDSLKWQEKVCYNFCQQNNWIVERCFGEKESGTSDNRKQFQEMLKFCEKERISHIVFFSYDRFSRTGDPALLKKLRSKGIKVHAATQSVDDETPSGRFSQSLYLMFAEMENEGRREKIIEGLKEKLERGEWSGNPPLGYEKRYVTGRKEHEHDKRQCFINEKGELLRQAFFWKEKENITNMEIIGRLKKMGLTVTPQKLSTIFRNPFYCGYITSSILGEGQIIRGKHEPLISEEVFLKVNGIVERNTSGWNVIRENDNMPLKASVRCEKCNRALTGYTRKGKYVYYKCPTINCKVNLRNHELHSLFELELSKYTFNTALFPLIRTELERIYWTLHKHDVSRSKPMKDELTRLKNELEQMELNMAVGRIGIDLYEKHSSIHKRRITEIEEELKTLNEDSSNFSDHLNIALQNACNLLKIWQLMDYSGKVRLQKLLFPDGIVYDSKNNIVRTHSVNPIISKIASISAVLSAGDGVQSRFENCQSCPVDQTFSSSNFFFENLENTALALNELAHTYSCPVPEFPQTALSVSGSTELPFYESSSTGNDNSYPVTTHALYPLYSGFTGFSAHI
jgi:site-specific DNA recombinase